MPHHTVKPTPGDITAHVYQALKEDLGGWVDINQDITASLIPSQAQAQAHIITREPMVMCGRDWAHCAFTALDNAIEVTWHVQDGQSVAAGTTLCDIKGNARVLLCAERTALNFLQTLSATATTTTHYVRLLKGTQTKLLDTRKTLPGFRQAQKYAVHCGGGNNHRVGLFDAYLIKENHIAACNGIKNAVQQAKMSHPGKSIEVEVETFEELEQALLAGADIIMLDNFTTTEVRQAVNYVSGRCLLEVSGNITDTRLSALASTGVDYISSGALTKHIQAIDLSMRLSLL
ncbi:carboxylating nicotinate-nucleotide diphosphorylase [Alteromonas sediminis]|uniref:Probable nicotinate-nucleotide pyrophosphorylase [carboxylating] n=1 Tax=Alteromonas sediminis TaxID=2259342 RepID=A0A3N5Y4C3_9ALTE|nr:carboxylating nicotinate-nucleotide diphosphorylase [Alteromonas sediminis]RPJ67963.1 carboxylating nicotinate-nucleotide diphosphorylase [Alteromonas sediminis]